MVASPAERVQRVLHLWGIDGDAAALLHQADDLARGGIAEASSTPDTWQALMVTKGPHAGQADSVREILARILAHGGHVVAVEPKPADEAEAIAQALYPDIGQHYTTTCFSETTWKRVDAHFDRPEFRRIFGVPYSRDLVLPADVARQQSGLSTEECAEVWATGRRPLSLSDAIEWYGSDVARVLVPDDGSYAWYRGPLPVGIQKVESAIMAFAMRHPQLRDGLPTIVVNGHFTLLSRSFGNGGNGATIITVELTGDDAFAAFRKRLIGHSDVPGECLKGSIRRDAADGHFGTDSLTSVTPWANVVHGSDGYLSGQLETLRLSHYSRTSLATRLLELGYTEQELRTFILPDPEIVRHGGHARLSQLTKNRPLQDCLRTIRWAMPPALDLGGVPTLSEPLLQALLDGADGTQWDVLETARPEPVNRRPAADLVPAHGQLRQDLAELGTTALARDGIGVLVPLAGSGGRFGGYQHAEGSAERMKPLLPLFTWDGYQASALDIRVELTESQLVAHGNKARYFFSCNHSTESVVRKWIMEHPGLDVRCGRVPESLRVHREEELSGGRAIASSIVRQVDGEPLSKPIGSYGLLWSAYASGTLADWQRDGVRVVAAANADDVGFALDPRIVGLLEADPRVDAVVLVVPTAAGRLPSKGGLVRERLGPKGWSVYIEENAVPLDSEEYFNTNQIYLRLSSLIEALGSSTASTLPTYLEAKALQVGASSIRALHAYRPYCDILRLLPVVKAIQISAFPTDHQPGGYSPLKTADDVATAQEVVDAIASRGGAHAHP